MTVLEDVKEHVRKLIDFTGREARVDYWVWAITMAIVVSTITTGIVAWRTFALFDQILDEGGFVRIRNIFIDARLWTVGGFFVVIAAATARRLHDVGRSALSACIPAGLTVAAFRQKSVSSKEETCTRYPSLVSQRGGGLRWGAVWRLDGRARWRLVPRR